MIRVVLEFNEISLSQRHVLTQKTQQVGCIIRNPRNAVLFVANFGGLNKILTFIGTHIFFCVMTLPSTFALKFRGQRKITKNHGYSYNMWISLPDFLGFWVVKLGCASSFRFGHSNLAVPGRHFMGPGFFMNCLRAQVCETSRHLAWAPAIANLGAGFKYFVCSPRSLRKWSNSTNIFQMGWNHQPEIKWIYPDFLGVCPSTGGKWNSNKGYLASHVVASDYYKVGPY